MYDETSTSISKFQSLKEHNESLLGNYALSDCSALEGHKATNKVSFAI